MADFRSGFVAVGFDGTPESAAALRWAARRAAEMRAPLKVVHCASSGPEASGGSPGERPRRGRAATTAIRRAQQELVAASRNTAAPPEVSLVSVSAPARSASTNHALVLANQARGAAMLVLGAASTDTMADPTRGPIAGRCVERVGCPVIVVDRRGRAASTMPRYAHLRSGRPHP